MARWLALDSSPLSMSVLQVLTLLADGLDWHPLQVSDAGLDRKELPDYCLSLARDPELVLRLLRRGIATYGPPRGYLRIVWLVDRGVAVRRVFKHLTPQIASEWLHDWKGDATPRVPLARVLDEILRPLAGLGYLQQEDLRDIEAYTAGYSENDHPLIEMELAEKILPRLRQYFYE